MTVCAHQSPTWRPSPSSWLQTTQCDRRRGHESPIHQNYSQDRYWSDDKGIISPYYRDVEEYLMTHRPEIHDVMVPVKDFEVLTQRSQLAERYYVMTQIEASWSRWRDADRDLWVKAYEATLPPEPEPEVVSVTLPMNHCTRAPYPGHRPHIWSEGACFCPGDPK